MKESISYTFLLNIIITFIVISFFAIMSIMSYSKAFRVNSKIVNNIEMYEGYNGAKSEIDRVITNYGYQRRTFKCPKKDGQDAINVVSGKTNDGTCVYLFDKGDTYSYGVVTYMTFDFPAVGSLIRIPIYTRTMTIKRLG